MDRWSSLYEWRYLWSWGGAEGRAGDAIVVEPSVATVRDMAPTVPTVSVT